MKKMKMTDFNGNVWILTGITYGSRITTFYFMNSNSGVVRTFYRYNCCASYFINAGDGVQRIRIRDFFPGWDSYDIPV